jgi:hypothetical protein
MTRKSPPKGGVHVEREHVRRGRGTARDELLPENELATAKDVLDWLQRETFAVSKEAELRIREATAIAADYSSGRISKREADNRLFRYDERWGEALGGMYNPDRKSDQVIVQEMDDIARWRREQEVAGSGKPPSR